MTHRKFTSLLLGAALFAALPLSACSQSAEDAITTPEDMSATAAPAAQPVQVSPAPNQTPLPADDGHAHDGDHSGHDHAAPAAPVFNPDAPEGTYAPIAADHAIGAADAPVSMIVYASVICPHCSTWFINDYPVIKRDYIETGKLRMIFREFPTAPAQAALPGFVIAGCGPDDQFINNIEYQMVNQKRIIEGYQAGKVEETFTDIGAQIGLDAAAVDACLQDPSNLDSVNRAMGFARAAQLSGVPAFIIDGTVYDYKSAPAASLSTLIDAAMPQ